MVKFRKSLALLLSVVLVVSFSISGIVLPVAAEETEPPVVEDETLEYLSIADFKHSAKLDGENGWAAGDAVTVQTDAVTGFKYTHIAAEGSAYKIKSPAFQSVAAGEIIGITFSVRKPSAGQIRIYPTVYNMGVNHPLWNNNYIEGDGNTGKWYDYTVYAQAKVDTTTAYFDLCLDSQTTDGTGMDIANVRTFKPDPDEINLLGQYGGFENGLPFASAGYRASGLFAKGAVVTTDPADNTNQVAYYKSGSQNQGYLQPVERRLVIDGASKDVHARSGYYYKVTYRQKGAGHTTITGHPSYTTRIAVSGSPDKASADWKTVTAYYKLVEGKTAASAYCFDFSAYGEIWLDDFAIYEVSAAEAIDLAVNSKMVIGETQTASYTTTKKHAYPGTVTYTSDNTAVATVNASTGLITGVGYGTANITATATIEVADGDPIVLTSTKAVTVQKPAATGIKLDITTSSLMVSDTLTLTPSIIPDGADAPASYTWKSSDPTVATVVDGIVTAKKKGEATITVSAEGLLPATCTITVNDELFPNGDFEGFDEATPVTKPWNNFLKEETAENPVVATVTAGVGVNGSYGLKMGSKIAYGSIVFSSKLTLKPNTNYRLSFMATSASVADSVRLSVNSWTGCKAYLGSAASNYVKVTTSHPGWTYYYCDFYTGDAAASIHDNGGLIIERKKADAAGATPICFDNFSLKQIDRSGELFLGGNPDNGVADGAFATELLKGFASVVDAPTEENPNNKAYKFTLSADKYLKQMPFRAGKKYKISFDYKGGQVVLDGKATFIGSKTAPSATEWTHFETILDPGTLDDGNRANWSLSIYRSTTNGVLVDNFSIIELVGDATAIELSDKELTMVAGDTATLEVVETPINSYVGTLTWTSSDDAIATVANGVITAKRGGEVTITVTTAGELTASCKVIITWPVEQFPNGDMEDPEDRPHFTDSKDLTWCEDGVGVDGSKALVFTGASKDHPHYFRKTDYKMRPNSLYVFSFVARSEGTTGQLQIDFVGGNCPGVKQYDNGWRNLTSEWTQYYMYLKTGDAPSMDPSYNIFLHPRALGADGAPLYVDNISLKLLETKDNILPNPDFTFEDENWDGAGKVNVEKDPDDSTNNVLAVYNTWNGSYDITGGMGYLDSYAMYELTFDSKVDAQWIADGSYMNFYIGEDDANTIRRGDIAFFGIDSVNHTTEWKKSTLVFFTNSMTKMNSNTLHFNVTGGTGTGKLFIDNMELRRVDDGRSVHGTTVGGDATYVSVDGGLTWNNYIKDVEPGTVVIVRPYEHGGNYNKLLTSLTTRNEDGKVNILNKDVINGYTAENFGQGSGRDYQFVMGEKGVRVESTLSAASSTSFKLDTVGTSLRYTEDDNFDGIRFLTRLQFVGGSLDAETGIITVLYNGKQYTVTEMGSVLARAGSYDGELTLDNAWQTAVAYAEGGSMKLLDYTGTYVDFTVVMKKGANVDQDVFEAREYAARGYIVLSDGTETVTLYSEHTPIDSVDRVQERL